MFVFLQPPILPYLFNLLVQITWARLADTSRPYTVLTIGDTTYINDDRYTIEKPIRHDVSKTTCISGTLVVWLLNKTCHHTFLSILLFPFLYGNLAVELFNVAIWQFASPMKPHIAFYCSEYILGHNRPNICHIMPASYQVALLSEVEPSDEERWAGGRRAVRVSGHHPSATVNICDA